MTGVLKKSSKERNSYENGDTDKQYTSLLCCAWWVYFDNKISEAHHAVKKLIQHKYGVKL